MEAEEVKKANMSRAAGEGTFVGMVVGDTEIKAGDCEATGTCIYFVIYVYLLIRLSKYASGCELR